MVMMWSTISLTGKTRLIITGDDLNAERYREKILQPVSVPYLVPQTGTKLSSRMTMLTPQSGALQRLPPEF